MIETFELVHEGDKRLIIGRAVVARKPSGGLTMKIRMHPEYSHMRGHYRQRIEDYMDETPWYRQRTYGDHMR